MRCFLTQPMYKNTYLEEASRLMVVESYLLHEHKKLFSSDLKGQAEKINEARNRLGNIELTYLENYIRVATPQELLSSFDIDTKWKLFHAVSYGCFDKELWNCVGIPELSWGYREISLNECILESTVGWAKNISDGYLPFNTLLGYAKNNLDLIKNQDKYDTLSKHDRSKDPIIGRETKEGILIHDGNGRLVKIAYSVVIQDQKTTSIIGFIGKTLKQTDIKDIDKQAFRLFKKNIIDRLSA